MSNNKASVTNHLRRPTRRERENGKKRTRERNPRGFNTPLRKRRPIKRKRRPRNRKETRFLRIRRSSIPILRKLTKESPSQKSINGNRMTDARDAVFPDTDGSTADDRHKYQLSVLENQTDKITRDSNPNLMAEDLRWPPWLIEARRKVQSK